MTARKPSDGAATASIGPNSLLAKLEAQPRVRTFLKRAVEGGRTSHAYLFVGSPGSGKLDAAWALAQALVCPAGGCGACEACVRASRKTHPDIHYYAPESVTGYLIDQVRSLIEDVSLAPIRAKTKVYIVNRADQLKADSANALLKTLEEPPAGVVFILLGISAETILPTIVSRCQCVPFSMVSPVAAARSVAHATGLPLARCRMAVAVAGSPARATEFLKSGERQEARRVMVRVLDGLPDFDDLDVLDGAREIVLAAHAPLDGVREEQKEALSAQADYLSRGAMKQLEARYKRELSARERSGIMEVLASARVLLRDVLIRVERADAEIVSEDAAGVVDRLAARVDSATAVRAVDAVLAAERNIARNVTPQLAVEVMLFDIRKALLCR